MSSDLIDRQSVLALYKKYQPYMAVNVFEFGKALENLPSAEPEQICYGCKHERYGSVCDSCSRFFLDRYEVDNNG